MLQVRSSARHLYAVAALSRQVKQLVLRITVTHDEIPRAIGMTPIPCHFTQHLVEWLEDGKRGKNGEGGKGDELDELDELLGCWADANFCRRRRLTGDAPASRSRPG